MPFQETSVGIKWNGPEDLALAHDGYSINSEFVGKMGTTTASPVHCFPASHFNYRSQLTCDFYF